MKSHNRTLVKNNFFLVLPLSLSYSLCIQRYSLSFLPHISRSSSTYPLSPPFLFRYTTVPDCSLSINYYTCIINFNTQYVHSIIYAYVSVCEYMQCTSISFHMMYYRTCLMYPPLQACLILLH